MDHQQSRPRRSHKSPSPAQVAYPCDRIIVNLYGLHDTTVSRIAFDQLVAGETDVALFYESELTPLAALLGNQNAPISFVSGCGGKYAVVDQAAVRCTTAYNDVEILSIYTVFASNTTVLTNHVACIPTSAQSKLAPFETAVEPITNAIVGAIGYRQDNIVTTAGSFQLIVPRTINGQLQSGLTVSNPNGQLSCAIDTF